MIEDYLEQVIDDNIKATGKGDQLHFNCPFCGDTRHRFYVSTYTHEVFCQNCNFGGTFISFIKELEGISYSEALERYKEINNSAYIPENVAEEISSKLLNNQILQSTEELAKRGIPLPDEYIRISYKKSAINPYNKMARKYLKSRAVTKQQVKDNEMGYCFEGKYSGRIIIPILEHKKLKFWVARAMDKSATKKELSPSAEDYQYSKSEVIFNIDRAVEIHNSIIISEGIFDALSWGSIGVSLLGKRISDEQICNLLQYKDSLKTIYIALDEDAYESATKIANCLEPYFEDIRMINLVGGDPNDILRKKGRKELLAFADSASSYNSVITKLKRKLYII